MALMGNPKLMLVDEVSAGVDPVARRKVWKAMRYEGENSALLLTTHTMEEAESLATKIGIMARGKLKCFGSLQQIQQTYGSGFEIEMNLRLDDLEKELEPIDAAERHCFDNQIINENILKWQNIMESNGTKLAMNFTDEFSRTGIYLSLWEKVHKGEKIDLLALMKDIQVQNEVACIVQNLTEEISFTEVIAFDGSYLVLRLEKIAGLTYGRLYAMMEQFKIKYAIKEYSCK